MDFDFLLQDRVQKVRQIAAEYNFSEKAYVAFSGGKDSLILSRLVDMALPDNALPRVYINTGMEYTMQVNFVRSLMPSDPRILIVNPTKNIPETLAAVGYPFKSKYHSHILKTMQNSGMTESVRKYFFTEGNHANLCPKILRYQATEPLPFKISERCCSEFKKKMFTPYEKMTKRNIAILGLRAAEGGAREKMTCLSFDRGKLRHFSPLIPCNNAFADEFVKRFDIKLSPLYYEPFSFQRTGCRGCPYNLHLREDLEKLAMFAPSEARAAYRIFRPVYDEYLRIGYRLKKGLPALQGELDL